MIISILYNKFIYAILIFLCIISYLWSKDGEIWNCLTNPNVYLVKIINFSIIYMINIIVDLKFNYFNYQYYDLDYIKSFNKCRFNFLVLDMNFYYLIGYWIF